VPGLIDGGEQRLQEGGDVLEVVQAGDQGLERLEPGIPRQKTPDLDPDDIQERAAKVVRASSGVQG